MLRAWTLRAMSGIRVHGVVPLVSMALKKCAIDPSPYVRRCAANAIPKLYDLEREEPDTAHASFTFPASDQNLLAGVLVKIVI